MPITIGYDLTKYKFIAAAICESRLRAKAEAREEARQEGREAAIRELTTKLLKKRFGRLPSWVAKRLAALSADQTLELVPAVLDAKSLKDFFGD